MEDQILAIAQDVYSYLEKNCIGDQISTFEVLLKIYPNGVPDSVEEALMDIHFALRTLVGKGRKFVLDPGENAYRLLGLPFNIPFYFRPRSAKSSAWKIPIPYFNTGEDYFKWISESHEGELPEPYERYFHNLYYSTVFSGYDQPIEKDAMIKALMRSQRTGMMIDIVPDDQFLPGGPCAGQCDNWSYHIEFIPMRDFFAKDYELLAEDCEDLPPKDEWVESLVTFPVY